MRTIYVALVVLGLAFWQVSTSANARGFTSPSADEAARTTRGKDASPSNRVVLRLGEGPIGTAVIDATAGFAYFGTATSPGIIVKVRLSDFTRVDALTLNAGESNLSSSVLDPTTGYAYFGTDTNPGRVVRVRLSDFSRVDALTLNPDENRLDAAVIDPGRGVALFAASKLDTTGSASTGRIVKIRLADFTHEATLPLSTGEDFPRSAVIDPPADVALFGTGTVPGLVIKVRLSDFTRQDALALQSGEGFLTSAVIDPSGGYALFASGIPTQSGNGIIVKVRVADLTRIGSVILNAGETLNVGSAIIDPSHDLALFSTSNAFMPAVVKLRLSDFSRIGAIPLGEGESTPTAAIADPTHGFAYFGTIDYPGRVAKDRARHRHTCRRAHAQSG